MKKILVLMLAAIVGIASINAANPAKDAKKEGKKLMNEGWKSAPGKLPIVTQLENAYTKQLETDENGYPKFIIGDAMSVGENFDGAKFQATELAKLDVAGKIASDITAIIDSQVANKQLEPSEAATLAETVGASKNLISKRLGAVIPLMECYRILPNKNTEVRVMVGYSNALAKKVVKEAIQEELKDKGQNLMDKLNKAIGL